MDPCVCIINVQGGEDPQDAFSFEVIFRKKNPIISGSCAQNDLQLKASCESLPPFRQIRTRLNTHMRVHKHTHTYTLTNSHVPPIKPWGKSKTNVRSLLEKIQVSFGKEQFKNRAQLPTSPNKCGILFVAATAYWGSNKE